jgi:regulator of replication initiation timing
MEIFSLNREIISENRIEELEEKIDRIIETYKSTKAENEKLKTRLQSIETNDKDSQKKMAELATERELLIEKVTKILEKVEKVEI